MGWIIEVIFRRFVSKENKERRWINPGYLKGPWLPLYGIGLSCLFLFADLGSHFATGGVLSSIFLILTTSALVIAVEFLSGVFSKKILHSKLWDYSNEEGNIEGLVCPKFALIWVAVTALYYFFLHDLIHRFLDFAVTNIPSIFALGIYLGFFFYDVIMRFRNAKIKSSL